MVFYETIVKKQGVFNRLQFIEYDRFMALLRQIAERKSQ
jgi:hypothetical protein